MVELVLTQRRLGPSPDARGRRDKPSINNCSRTATQSANWGTGEVVDVEPDSGKNVGDPRPGRVARHAGGFFEKRGLNHCLIVDCGQPLPQHSHLPPITMKCLMLVLMWPDIFHSNFFAFSAFYLSRL
uniref:Uncharacterized protein n=1 Tax=Angiostrongylus cantonensis TaxID=6313 RepID=A0A0K0CUT2_ANGCA